MPSERAACRHQRPEWRRAVSVVGVYWGISVGAMCWTRTPGVKHQGGSSVDAGGRADFADRAHHAPQVQSGGPGELW